MRLFTGKKGLVLGVANENSIAWAVTRQLLEHDAEVGLTHLPDRPDDERQRNRRRVEKFIEDQPGVKLLVPMNVQSDEDIRAAMRAAGEQFGGFDFLVHSIAFADKADLLGDTIDVSREGFLRAIEISAYSLIAVAREARPFLNRGASIVTMTYFGGEKIIPGYNMMGICKAALDSSVRYLAHDLGLEGIRVNAVSAGPVRTLSGKAAGVDEMLQYYSKTAPLGRNVTHDEVARTSLFLLSDMSNGITAEILHVDGGFNAMGSPGRLLENLRGQDLSRPLSFFSEKKAISP